MRRKIIVLLLALAMMFSLSACNKGNDKNGEASKEANTSDQLSSEDKDKKNTESEKRTVTDALGRQVEIPAKIEKIVPLANTPRMITYLGLADKAVGIEECEIAKSPLQAYAYINKDKWSKLPNCGTNSMGETAYYPEQIMSSKPDVILTTDNSDVADNLQNQTGIPVVCVSQGTLFGDDYKESLRILADVCGVKERAEELIKYIDDNLADLADRAKKVPDEGKPTVLAAGASFKGGHSIDGIYTNYSVFKVLSANDVAKELAGKKESSGVMVDREKILGWNPEIIFFDAGNMGLVKKDYADNAGYFNQLRAVKEGKLYQWPNSTWHWSNVEIPLVSAYYVGNLLYPEAFKDVDFEAKASEIFDTFLGHPDYLRTLEEAGAGYGKVNLGE